MTDDEDIARYAKGIPVLERLGIWPEYCEVALGSLCGAYARVFDREPSNWAAMALELDHPDLQATIAYYRAVGPYERRTGRMVLEADTTLPENAPAVTDYSDPTYSRIVGLDGCPEERQRQLLEMLLEIAPPDRLPSRKRFWQNMLDEAIRAIAEEAVRLECERVHITLPHGNPSAMAGAIIFRWRVSVRPRYNGLWIRFEFTGAVDSPQWPKRIYGR